MSEKVRILFHRPFVQAVCFTHQKKYQFFCCGCRAGLAPGHCSTALTSHSQKIIICLPTHTSNSSRSLNSSSSWSWPSLGNSGFNASFCMSVNCSAAPGLACTEWKDDSLSVDQQSLHITGCWLAFASTCLLISCQRPSCLKQGSLD